MQDFLWFHNYETQCLRLFCASFYNKCWTISWKLHDDRLILTNSGKLPRSCVEYNQFLWIRFGNIKLLFSESVARRNALFVFNDYMILRSSRLNWRLKRSSVMVIKVANDDWDRIVDVFGGNCGDSEMRLWL